MKKISATEAKNNFGAFIDTALQEGVLLTRNGRAILQVEPVGGAGIAKALGELAASTNKAVPTDEALNEHQGLNGEEPAHMPCKNGEREGEAKMKLEQWNDDGVNVRMTHRELLEIEHLLSIVEKEYHRDEVMLAMNWTKEEIEAVALKYTDAIYEWRRANDGMGELRYEDIE